MYAAGVTLGFGYLDPFIRIGIEFILGIFLYYSHQNKLFHSDRWGLVTMLAIIAVLVTSAAFYFTGYDNFAYTAVVFFPIIIYSLAQKNNFFVKALSGKVAMIGGLSSYSLYMTHNIWLMVAKALIPAEYYRQSSIPVKSSVFLIYLIPCLLIAIATYYIVEEPSRKWLNRLFHHSANFKKSSA